MAVEIRRRRRAEVGDAQIAMTLVEQHPRDAVHLDARALERDLDHLRAPGAAQHQLHERTGGAAHLLDGGGDIAAHRRTVDAQDDVARTDAGPPRRRIVDGAQHLDGLAVGDHLDPDAWIAAGGAATDVLVLTPVEIGGMRIEARHHAARGLVEQPLGRDLIDVFAADAAEDLGETPCLCGRQRGLEHRQRSRLGRRGTRRRAAPVRILRGDARRHERAPCRRQRERGRDAERETDADRRQGSAACHGRGTFMVDDSLPGIAGHRRTPPRRRAERASHSA